MLVLLVIIVSLNMFLSHCVTLPTSRLRNAMGQLQGGEPGVQVSISSRDEIGQMAAAFNEMSSMLCQQKAALTNAITAKDAYALKLKNSNTALGRLNKNLEARVQERTADLSSKGYNYYLNFLAWSRLFKKSMGSISTIVSLICPSGRIIAYLDNPYHNEVHNHQGEP